MNTSDLQRALHADAELAGPPPIDLMDRIEDVGRSRRRRRTGVVATAMAAALIAIAVPTTVALVDGTDRSSVAGPDAVQLHDGPTRGSLAQDTALVAAVADLSWPGAAPDDSTGVEVDPPAGARHVVFLGDVAGTRYALVTGEVDGGLWASWFTAPVGGDAATFGLAGQPKFISGTDPQAFTDTTVTTPVVLVIAAPGDRVDFSDRAVLTAGGSITRTYTPGEQLGDGVAAMTTSPDEITAVSVRVTRDSIVVYRSRPDVDGDLRVFGTADPLSPDETAQVADPRGLAGTVDPALVSGALADIASPLQVPLGELQPTLLWAGAIPGPAGYTSTAVVVGITAPSGASIAYGIAFSGPGDGSYGIYLAGWETYDRDHPLLDQAQLLRATVSDGTATGQPVTSLLLLSPVNATSILQAALGSPDGEVTEATDGALLVPGDTDTSSAVLLDVTTGQTLAEAQLMPSDYVDHYDYGTGPR